MKAELIQELEPFVAIEPVILVDDQDVRDIIRGMQAKQVECRPMYDAICGYFDGDCIEDIGLNIWSFLKSELVYAEQTKKVQRLASPKTLLKRGRCDCKEYALFSAGVIDAMNRRGAGIDWCFRFVPAEALTRSIGHVFVVLEPGGDEIWIDPVLSMYDSHVLYLVQKDVYVKDSALISGLSVDDRGAIGLTKVEQTLLDQLNEYTLGVQDAVSVSTSSGTINTITAAIVQTASSFIPGVGLALGALKAVGTLISNNFGAGSLAARLVSDITTNLLLAPYAIVKTLLNPGARTFESDQYDAAWKYYYFVLGQTKYKNAPQQVTDQQVPTALKWFIDRAGVYISGDQHLTALTKSASDYTNYYGVNHYTTTDVTLVGPASQMAQQYWNLNGAAGSWANTVGVFDVQLIEIAQQMGESVEQVNAQVQSGAIDIPGITPSDPLTKIKQLLSSPWPWVIGVGVIAILILWDDD
jgi:hypothetical protein